MVTSKTWNTWVKDCPWWALAKICDLFLHAYAVVFNGSISVRHFQWAPTTHGSAQEIWILITQRISECPDKQASAPEPFHKIYIRAFYYRLSLQTELPPKWCIILCFRGTFSLPLLTKALDHNTQTYELRHEIYDKVVCATSKASEQPVHTRSLIRAFASRLNIIWLLSYRLNTIWSF